MKDASVYLMGDHDWNKLEVDTYVPRAEPYDVTQSKPLHRMVRVMRRPIHCFRSYHAWQISGRILASAVNGLIDWSQQFCPFGDWESLRPKDR